MKCSVCDGNGSTVRKVEQFKSEILKCDWCKGIGKEPTDKEVQEMLKGDNLR